MEISVLNKIPKDKMIYAIILLNPIAEIIYSIFYKLGINIPINQAIRFVGLIVLVLLVQQKKTKRYIATIFVLYQVIWILQLIAGFTEFSFGNIVFSFKLFYSTTLIFIFKDFVESKTVDIQTLMQTIVYSTFVILFSVCISPFGLGFEAWQGTQYRTGYVGWFLFSNYLTVTLLLVFSIMFCCKKINKKIIMSCWFLVTLLLLGNKAGIVGILGYLAVLGGFYLIQSKWDKRKKYILLISAVVGCIILPFAISFLVNFVQDQMALYKQYGYKDIWTYLLSNRNIQLMAAEQYIEAKDYNTVLGALIGYGNEGINGALQAWGRGYSIEMDLYALKYYVGYVPVLIWCAIYVGLFVKAIQNISRYKTIQSVCLGLGLCIGIAHSILTGHVIFESLTMIYMAVLGALIMTYEKM